MGVAVKNPETINTTWFQGLFLVTVLKARTTGAFVIIHFCRDDGLKVRVSRLGFM